MWFQRHRRERLLALPYPEGWESFLLQNVGHYRLLSPPEQARLRNDSRILIAEKNWEGCRGLHITDEIKVTIAAQACLLLLGLDHDYFQRVLSILVYPSAFRLPDEDGGVDNENGEVIVGEAVYRGPVILSWEAVLAEGKDPFSGQNVVIHEFAHQLDFLDDSVNGTPDLRNMEQARRWHNVMSDAYARLQSDLRRQRDRFWGKHASLNETEFFAVASERFFTVPHALRQRYPALHEILIGYYGVDPNKWFARTEGKAWR